ncbi:unnamed protein product [Prunus brigantina]
MYNHDRLGQFSLCSYNISSKRNWKRMNSKQLLQMRN